MSAWIAWAPAVLMGFGALFTVGINPQQEMPLRSPLASEVPDRMVGFVARDVTVPDAEAQVAGFTDYLMRVYQPEDDGGADTPSSWFSVYVGYYDNQMQGRTIHSPKNCLPGAGWEALRSSTADLGDGIRVNRYVLQRQDEQALVLYWYQGRGRVEENEYVVKWDLLRDAALRRRSDEALVRIVVPIETNEEDAFRLARDAAWQVLPAVDTALPS